MIVTTVIMGLALVAVGSVWFFIKNRKKDKVTLVPSELLPSSSGHNGNGHKPAKDAKDSFIDNLVAVDARVYDNATRTVRNETIPAEGVRQIRKDNGNLGRRWFRDGQWRYAAVRLTTGVLVPVDSFMSLSLKNPPERLHRALQQQETATYYKPHDNRGTLAKYGAYLLFAGAVIVILFLWGATMLKGT
jgi:hypothetical protein